MKSWAKSGVSVADVYPDCQNHCRLMADGEAGQTGLHVQDPVGEVCRRPRGNVINQDQLSMENHASEKEHGIVSVM